MDRFETIAFEFFSGKRCAHGANLGKDN